MKIDILFQVDDNSNDFFSAFFSSKFFKTTTNATYYFYVKEGVSLDFLKFLPTKLHYEIRKTQKDFNINDAFLDYLKQNSSCDVLLLGDTKVANLGKLFEKCLEKNKDGANIVHIKKKKEKITGFFATIKEKFVNFFLSLYTNKKDKFNIPTLGLLDKNILDVLRVLPHKACFLKNTNDFYGYNGRTIYIPDNTKCYKENFCTVTQSLKTIFVFLGVNLLSVAGIVLSAVFSKIILLTLSIFLTLGSLAGIVLLIPKHFLDVRSKSQGATFESVNIQKDKEAPQSKVNSKQNKKKEALTNSKSKTVKKPSKKNIGSKNKAVKKSN